MKVENKNLYNSFTANKLSLNINKIKYTLVHKKCFKDDITLKLPELKIEILNIERSSSITFLRGMLDEHINLDEHMRDRIKIVESKITKDIGLLH